MKEVCAGIASEEEYMDALIRDLEEIDYHFNEHLLSLMIGGKIPEHS